MTRVLAPILAASVLLVAACGDSGGKCPEPKPLNYFTSDSFTAPEGAAVNWYCNQDCGVVFEPHDGVGPLALDIDMEAERVTITYERDGKTIVEKWKITSRKNF